MTAAIVRTFVESKLSLLFLVGSLLAGVAGLTLTPREEEPQIIVPMVDVLISQPGSSAVEIERQSVDELESLVRGLPGVEHVYSRSARDNALVSVRFKVGHDREKALVDTSTRIQAFVDRVSPSIAGFIVRPVDIDDVPVLTLALHGDGSERSLEHSIVELGRIAEELAIEIGSVADVALVEVLGSQARVFEVVPNIDALRQYGISLLDLAATLRAADAGATVGRTALGGQRIELTAGPYLQRLSDLRELIVKVDSEGRPVYLTDLAQLSADTFEPDRYTRIGFGPASRKAGVLAEDANHDSRNSVAISVAKRKGANAVRVTEEVLAAIGETRLLPEGLGLTVTRNDGATADRKVNELVEHITVAIITVILVLMLGLGVREALIVAITVPVTFSIALAANLIFGYTINRVTLFALVLSLGLLVDDPIVDVENIHRHYKLRLRSAKEAVIYAVNEVRPPLILATLTVIVSFLPMNFITGMMGPYMAPMPFNITVVMISSLIVALTITPWASYLILKRPDEHDAEHTPDAAPAGLVARLYRGTMGPLMRRSSLAYLALGGLFVVWLGSIGLGLLGVPLKMLPFSNKDRLQVSIEMPEGTTLEATDRVVRELADALLEVEEATFVESFTGTTSPHDFQGLVRHDFMRRGANVGDIRLGLLPDDLRQMQSHQIALRLRAGLEKIATKYDAKIAIVEVPPGPPVLQTVVAEVTAPRDAGWDAQLVVAADVMSRFEAQPGVVDVDWQINAVQGRRSYDVDRPRAGRAGVSVGEVVKTLGAALGETAVADLHEPHERHPRQLYLRLSEADRGRTDRLESLPLRQGARGEVLTLGQVVATSAGEVEQAITHKDGQRVVFVTGDAVGVSPAEAVFGLQKSLAKSPLPEGFRANFSGEGEWKITLDVFRDLGLAFGAALLGIYVLLVGQTGSLLMPLVMMVAIPVTAIGIFPGFYLINQISVLRGTAEIAGLGDPTWFTATAMIGMIALAGIVVRNSVILVDFIEVQLDEGLPLAKAVVEAGVVRLRPILLTAGTSLLGIWVMTLDPVFSGLAWSFIFGILASTFFTLVVVPLIYFLLHRKQHAVA